MSDIFSAPALTALLQVIMIDLVLAGDNAVVIGLATAGLPPEQRRRAILIGIAAATVLRIAFAGVATQLRCRERAGSPKPPCSRAARDYTEGGGKGPGAIAAP